MADKKISQLTALSAANVAPATDVLAIVDTSATETKKITAKDLIDGALNGGTANGVLYLNGSKVATSGSALVFDGTNLGIGTASPAQKLQVENNANSSTWAYVKNTNSGSGAAAGLLFANNTGDLGAISLLSSANTPANGLFLRSLSTNVLALGTNNTVQATLDSSGNLLVGSGISGARLSIRDGGSNDSYFGLGANYDVYISSGSSGTHYFRKGSTSAMTLDASGNLGVGTTSPDIFGRFYTRSVGFSSSGTTALQINGTTYGTIDLGANGTRILSVTGASTEATISAVANVPLRFETNSAERGRFTAGGYFKASNAGTYQGATGAYHELRTDAADYSTIVGNTNASPYGAYILFGSADPNNSTNLFLLCNGWNGSTLVTRATIRSNGGLANYQANDVNLSDERVKTDIAPLGSMWAKIKALEIVTFKYKDQTHDDDNIGLIAQQVESVAPEFVDTDGFGETPEDGVPLKTVYTTDMYHAAIKALQEAMVRIESLEADMAALKGAK